MVRLARGRAERIALPDRMVRQFVTQFTAALRAQVGDLQEREARPGSLIAWNRKFLPSAFSKPSSPMHDWLYEQLERCEAERGVFVNAVGPRGNAKSEVTRAYALRCACEATEMLIWIIADTSDQAEAQLDGIREQLEDNRLLAAAYPDACGKGRIWRRNRLDLRNGVSIQSFGTGQAIRGRKKGSVRPSLIIGDDLQNDNVITSGKRREKEQRWFDDVPMKAGTTRTNVIVVGTSLHADCIVENHNRRPGWISKKFPAIVKWPHRMDKWEQWEQIYSDRQTHGDKAVQRAREFYLANPDMNDGAEVLWPQWESLYDLMSLRARDGHVSFEREKQANPITPETCYFPPEWFDDRQGVPSIWFKQWPAKLKVKMLTLDPSMGKTDRSDYSAYIYGGLDHDGIMWVDASIKRRTIPALVRDGIDLWRDWMPHTFGVETNQFQGALPELFSLTCRQEGLTIATRSINNSENKEIRIRRLEPWLCNRKIRIRRSPGGLLLVDQLRQFPGGLHDDGPDALEMFVHLILMLQRRKR